MSKIDDKINAFKAFESEINEVIRNILQDNEAFICDMNSQVQLYENGVDRNNVEIKSYAPYSSVTIDIKSEKGQVTSRVTLRDTGDFHRSFYLEINDTNFEIKVADSKSDKILESYGEQILGLTDSNLNEVIWEYIYPILIKKLRESI